MPRWRRVTRHFRCRITQQFITRACWSSKLPDTLLRLRMSTNTAQPRSTRFWLDRCDSVWEDNFWHNYGRVPGEIKRSRDLRGGRWSWTLTFAQKRTRVGRWSWAEQVGRLLLRVVQVVRQQRCNGHCLSDCPAQQLKEQLHSAQVAGQWRGDTALTLPLFWRRSTVSPVFFGRFPRSSLSLSRPLPGRSGLSPSLIGHLASVDIKQHESIIMVV